VERPRLKRSDAFAADAMLGSLARKLRIMGFDTLYFSGGGDPELEELARKEKRVILTSDVSLYAHARRHGVDCVLIRGRTDIARLRELVDARGIRIGPRSGWPSRCAICNGELEPISREEAAEGVPQKSLHRHRMFFRCISCSRYYWHGNHWNRLGRLSSSLDRKGLT
jgi:uncharacterized protein with PIN domain